MKEIVEFLFKSQVQYLATIGLDRKPKVRPFQFMFEHNGRLWFCTSNQKKVYKELEHQPYIELCASGDNMSWLRIEGEVVFEDNLVVKEMVFKHSPLVAGIYKDPANPSFEVFYLDNATASISKIGMAPQVITL